VPGYLVDGADDLRREWFDGKRCAGVTAGASAPEVLVKQVIARLQTWGGGEVVEIQGRPENVVFSLPRALRPVTPAA
jgi:4-hydroxy-3-methylbut-2-enyl diphosphate reductase